MDAFSAVLASMFRRFGVDSLLASVLVSFALESLRGKSDTLEFDDTYEGFATFFVLAKRCNGEADLSENMRI